ncbi:MAG: peptide chain release factor 2 [Gemmataceae bacterium]|nr:peptide chain release factor 2 [Gemmataceae bacterium]
MNADLRRRSEDVLGRIVSLRDSLDIVGKQAALQDINARMEAPDFWNNPEKARAVIASAKPLNTVLKPFADLAEAGEDLKVACEFAEEDASFESEVETKLGEMEGKLAAFELASMLDGAQDGANAFLKIQAGTGGTEACDWAEMLLRVYTRWAERRGYAVELMDRDDNEEAGIRSATLRIAGENAYGYLNGESGVHRLVRISPFDSAARRQTSFAAVDVTPELDDSIVIEIKPEDLRRDTFRSGGPGGQHQNKTESGVRYTHLPTGVAAESRSERSQHKNDANALKQLKAKMYKIEEEKRRAEVERTYDEKGEVSFGRQIRNYTLQPYTLVKDTRTGHEAGGVQAVLDGDIDDFITAYLRMKTEQKNKKK